MSIDYDRLRGLLQDFDQAETFHAKWEAHAVISTSVEVLARDLLRLRDGVEQLREEMADLHHAGRIYRSKETNAVVPAHAVARHLTNLLNGDTE